MKLSERDEVLIQRCVDGELSSEDTASLLRRLDALEQAGSIWRADFWKTGRCGGSWQTAERWFRSPAVTSVVLLTRPTAFTGPPRQQTKLMDFGS